MLAIMQLSQCVCGFIVPLVQRTTTDMTRQSEMNLICISFRVKLGPLLRLVRFQLCLGYHYYTSGGTPLLWNFCVAGATYSEYKGGVRGVL